jgi:putative hemolysin
MALTGHLPALGERVIHQGWVFEVIDLDGRRVDKVLATQRSVAPKKA